MVVQVVRRNEIRYSREGVRVRSLDQLLSSPLSFAYRWNCSEGLLFTGQVDTAQSKYSVANESSYDHIQQELATSCHFLPFLPRKKNTL